MCRMMYSTSVRTVAYSTLTRNHSKRLETVGNIASQKRIKLWIRRSVASTGRVQHTTMHIVPWKHYYAYGTMETYDYQRGDLY